MSQQELANKKSWVLISNFKDNITEQEVQRIIPNIEQLVDQWHSQGKIMLSGALDDNQTAMTVFDATEQDAKDFLDKYDDACQGALNYHMYQWDAMPILSMLEKQN